MADTKASCVEEFFSYLYRSINIPRRIVWNGDDKELLEGWNRYFDEDLDGGIGESVTKTAILHQNISAVRSEYGSETTIGIPYTVPLERNGMVALPQNHLLFFTSLFNPFCLGFIHPRWLRMENAWWTHSREDGIPFKTPEPIPAFESQSREDGTVFTALYTRNFVLTNLCYSRIEECVKFIYDPELDPENEFSDAWNWGVYGVYTSRKGANLLKHIVSKKQLQEDFHNFVLNKAASTIQKFFRKYSLRLKFKYKVLPSIECLATFRYRNEEKVDPETLEWWKEFELEQVRELFSEVWE